MGKNLPELILSTMKSLLVFVICLSAEWARSTRPSSEALFVLDRIDFILAGICSLAYLIYDFKSTLRSSREIRDLEEGPLAKKISTIRPGKKHTPKNDNAD